MSKHAQAKAFEKYWSRRSFLASSAALAISPWISGRARGAVRRQIEFGNDPFQLGVTSGDPSPDGVVLWTRLAPDPINGGGMPPEDIAVSWQIASDENMKTIVRSGEAIASPALGHSVHVEVEGLQPDRWYWYQFKVGRQTSPVGRTRTTPAFDANPSSLRFAFASCQHFESGYFTAYEHMAREDLDLVVHLGDYIYENGARDGQPRRHTGGELHTLEEYRNRYALYRSDKDLRAAHANFPWLVTWDDHEFDNNYAADISEQPNVNVAAFLKRRAAAYQAYYEHMPLRKAAKPVGPDMRLYRVVPFGQLASFDILDTRQYRTDQPCGDRQVAPCPEAFDPEATILGVEQEKWLQAQLAASPAQWNILAQQVMMARADRRPGEAIAYSMDQWPGYAACRDRLLTFLAERQIANPVVLTGDIHKNWVNDLKLDFDDENSQTVGAEFVGTSISSGGDGSQTTSDTAGVLSENPFVKFYNAERGYVSCEVTPKEWRSHYRVVEYVTRRGAPLVNRASFVVEDGQAGVERA